MRNPSRRAFIGSAHALAASAKGVPQPPWHLLPATSFFARKIQDLLCLKPRNQRLKAPFKTAFGATGAKLTAALEQRKAVQIRPEGDRRRRVIRVAGHCSDKRQNLVPQVFAGAGFGAVGRAGVQQQRVEVRVGAGVAEVSRGGRLEGCGRGFAPRRLRKLFVTASEHSFSLASYSRPTKRF